VPAFSLPRSEIGIPQSGNLSIPSNARRKNLFFPA
jgi:hypothetical protein